MCEWGGIYACVDMCVCVCFSVRLYMYMYENACFCMCIGMIFACMNVCRVYTPVCVHPD